MTLVHPDSEISRVLVITAHPDDVDFGAAGTIAHFTAAGLEVVYCICTDGQAGGFEDHVPRSKIPEIRRAEQTEAARRVGVHDVRFLGLVDGELEANADLVRALTRVIREVRPERVLTQSPERDWSFIARSHPDHLAAGEAAVRAVYPAARNPYAFPELAEEGLAAWTVREVWLSGHPTTNHVVDVTETFDKKMAALYAHQSQHPEPDQLEPRLREGFGRVAATAGLPQGHLAEGYFVVETG
ncbi:PIG-L deacetylase family protein [Actinopolymorpha singaporensis]|uniref:N-acetylglucosaminyl deacetylase, LmbE family n=1 Tax=Actinopolymorpha singaporensis TaxID=117157 RepID=A0A1H1SIF7_9ACTN|nr:PIG-L deacetylase family protein [Actinopolymorpha singaporensis]SDS47721.1 N-acetylglucosaminyl deacetylase, LmbE family [Actinopolymorpha singaporensis]